MTSQSIEQHITLEQLSAPSEGLSTLVSIHECRKNSLEIRKAGTGATFLIMLCNYSVLLPLHVSPLEGRDTSECKQISSHVPVSRYTHMLNEHLLASRSSLAASKADSAGCVID